MPERCCKTVYGGSFRGHPCTKPAKVQVGGSWFCVVHGAAKFRERRLKSAGIISSDYEALRQTIIRESIPAHFHKRLVEALNRVTERLDAFQYEAVSWSSADENAVDHSRELLAEIEKEASK